MICWASKPKTLFKEVIQRTFDMTIDELKTSIEVHDNCTLFSDKIVKMFGGLERLYAHVKMLEDISRSPKVYLISDYSFLLLDRMLNTFCPVYTDIVAQEADSEKDSYAIFPRGKKVMDLDADELIDIYFFDTDYDFDAKVYNLLSADVKKQIAVNPETFGVVNRMMPHPDELASYEIPVNKRTWERLDLDTEEDQEISEDD